MRGLAAVRFETFGYRVQRHAYLIGQLRRELATDSAESSESTLLVTIPYWRKPGREVEIGRFTETNASGHASHRDLYTIMLHEFGHLLGMAWNSWRYGSETADGDIDVVTWHVNPGLSWLSESSHITYAGNPNVLMFPRVPAGHRRWPSQADISCLSQISGWWTTSWGDGGGGVTGLAANNPVNM
jgi:hypothetical protein